MTLLPCLIQAAGAGDDRGPAARDQLRNDLINPPELGILESRIKQVKQGRAIVIPQGDKTNGHGTHTLAPIWKDYLADLLQLRWWIR